MQTVYAHISKGYGNITVEYGWSEEPPLQNKINNIIIGVAEDSEENSVPVRNALTDMNIQIKYGGITKGLQFIPSDKEAGLFEAEIIPTRIGSYSLVLYGMIQEQPISDEVSIEDVESKQRISFPQSAGDSSVGTGSGAFNINLGGQLSSIISQITEDMDNVKQDTLANGNAVLDRGIENVMGTFDAFYMVAVTAIGVGAAGIIIGSAAS